MGPDLGHAVVHDLAHMAAALVLVGGGAAFIALSWWRRSATGSSAVSARSVDPDRRGGVAAGVAAPVRAGDRSLAVMLAALSAGAGVIHLAAAPGHYRELGDLGAGFLVAATFQLAWAVRWRRRPTRRLATAGIVGNGLTLGAWLASRTIGLPMLAGPEPVGLPDGAATAFEVALVALLVSRGTRFAAIARRSGRLRTAASIGLVPVVGVVLLLSSLATVAIAAGLEHGQPAGAGTGVRAGPAEPGAHDPTH